MVWGKYLPLILANSSAGFKDLTEDDINKLLGEFLKVRNTVLLFLASQNGYKMHVPGNPEGFIGGDSVSKLYIPPESDGKPNIPNPQTLKNLHSILSMYMKIDLTKLDMAELLPLIKSFFMLSPDSEELKYPEIRESLKQYIRPLALNKKIV